MFQIDNASAAAVQPASTPPGTAGFFTDGNPATSQAATIVPAEWLNSVMMELINAVTGSGQTPDKTKFNQLLTAIQNAGGNIGVTPPQFDNTTKTATTAFVQRALGSKSSWTTVSAAATLTAAHIGQNITLSGTAAFTVTLPLTSAIPAGGVISLRCSSSQTITVACQGSDAIGYGGSNTASMTIKSGDTLELLSTNSGTWFIIGGSAALPYSALFGSSIAASGYQKFPTGLIIQWTAFNVTSTTGSAFNWPIAFPNNCYGAAAVDSGSAVYSYGITIARTGGTAYSKLGGTAAAAGTGYAIAIGN